MEDEFIVNNMALKLSDYAIFEGEPSNLLPAQDYTFYNLSSELFTDYSEKQRLIKLPEGNSASITGNGIPDFPNGTILVKTFYYFNDKRDSTKGKKLIETRLLIKTESDWKVGTYKWNEDQSDAFLITSGYNQTVNWFDDSGELKLISYRIPNNIECRSCHVSGDQIIPIGPKVRNLNTLVEVDGVNENQLDYLIKKGIFGQANPQEYSSLPNYKDPSISLDLRGRAYLDINCAHCHSQNGLASGNSPRFSYDESLSSSRIPDVKDNITRRIERGTMPKTGTTIIHAEGVELLKAYLNSL